MICTNHHKTEDCYFYSQLNELIEQNNKSNDESRRWGYGHSRCRHSHPAGAGGYATGGICVPGLCRRHRCTVERKVPGLRRKAAWPSAGDIFHRRGLSPLSGGGAG